MAEGYAGKIQAEMTRSGFTFDIKSFNKLSRVADISFGAAGFVHVDDGSNVLYAKSFSDAGHALAAMIPEDTTLTTDNPYDFGGVQAGPIDGNIVIESNDPNRVKIGSIVISASTFSAAVDAHAKAMWNTASADAGVPGLSPDDFEAETYPGMQEGHDSFMHGMQTLQSAVTVAGFVSSTYQLMTPGRVDLYYNPNVGTYSYLVQEHKSTINGWTFRSVSQIDQRFQNVEEGTWK